MSENTEKELKRIKGRMLISMPHMADPRFYKTTLAVLRHDASGASAIIFNKPSKSLIFSEVCLDMGLRCHDKWKNQPILMIGTTVYIFETMGIGVTKEQKKVGERSGKRERSFIALYCPFLSFLLSLGIITLFIPRLFFYTY